MPVTAVEAHHFLTLGGAVGRHALMVLGSSATETRRPSFLTRVPPAVLVAWDSCISFLLMPLCCITELLLHNIGCLMLVARILVGQKMKSSSYFYSGSSGTTELAE